LSLKRRAKLIEIDVALSARAFNEYSGISADEQERRFGLITARVRMPSGPVSVSKPALPPGTRI
jgi:hypothetical protein